MARSCALGVLLCVLGLLSPALGQDSCLVQPGTPGAAGEPGLNGRSGAKGEKGEPAPVLQGHTHTVLAAKGNTGERGPAGGMGPKGYQGELGPEGSPGVPGSPGSPGEGGDVSRPRSAFSVFRNDTKLPNYNQKISFQTTLVNTNSDFELNTGQFSCKLPGVYYFVFHSESKTDMCLNLRSEALEEEKKLVFCDYSQRGNSQVLSGGVVLKLRKGQKVWLEMFKDKQNDNTPRDTQDKQIVFNGFLISTA